MKCGHARKLFASYWDDETTQAEREWVEAHFLVCAECRREYEAYARAMELVASLPRQEAAPDLLERTLARARRATPARDDLPARGVAWVPMTAAAALLVLSTTLVLQWVGPGALRETRVATSTSVAPTAEPVATEVPAPAEPIAAVADSLFDPADDIEFVLDPVTLRRGRATVQRGNTDIHAEQAVISF